MAVERGEGLPDAVTVVVGYGYSVDNPEDLRNQSEGDRELQMHPVPIRGQIDLTTGKIATEGVVTRPLHRQVLKSVQQELLGVTPEVVAPKLT